jgi:hypothetical protein
MDGFAQIKAFYSWVFNNPDKIRPTHISLYLFLVNQNNRSMWVEWFKCPYDLAMQGACIGNKNTYYKCLDELVLFNLIEYKKGINNYKAPLIKLLQLYDSVPQSGNVTVPLSEPQTEPLSVLLNKNTYKLITNNYKLINDNLESWLSSVIILTPESKKFTPPTLLEVTDYFLEKGYSDSSAKKAWEYYESGNWKDSKGNQVKSWKQKMHGVWFKPENLIVEKKSKMVY